MRSITRACSLVAVALLIPAIAAAASLAPGDLDASSRATVRDAVLLAQHLQGGPALPDSQMPLADLDQDGVLAEADLGLLAGQVLGRSSAFIAAAHLVTSPLDGEGDVAVTRETVLRLRRPLSEDHDPTSADIFATLGDDVIPARLHLSPDRRTVTLFYLLRLPASTRVRVTVKGDQLDDAFGMPIDADGDGAPGGTGVIDFDTLTLSTVPGTSVYGRVFASEPGQDGGATVETPLEGVTITVDGMESTMLAVTDADGNFTLSPAPAGPFFVHINGPAATEVGSNDFYAEVGKLWESVAGTATSVGDIFLPLVTSGTLQDASLTQPTTVEFPQEVKDAYPDLAGVRLGVGPDTLFSDAGERGGQIGIAPVASDRLPGPLPEGLDLPMVITVQTSPGANNFDRPVEACFPNLPDPATGERLPPGGKTALWSFDHDTGHWNVVGPMTVNAEGTLACTDPGYGIIAPGWHGTAGGSGGSGGGGGPEGGPPDPPPPPPPCWRKYFLAGSGVVQCVASAVLAIPKFVPAVACLVGAGQTAAGTAVDCAIDPSSCGDTVKGQALGFFIGFPACLFPATSAAAGIGGVTYSCYFQAGGAIEAYKDCRSGTGASGFAGASTDAAPEPSMLQQQAELWAIMARHMGALWGDPRWGQLLPEDMPAFEAIQAHLRSDIDPASPGGVRITEAERASFLALPRPTGIDLEAMAAAADRFDLIAAGLLSPEEMGIEAIAESGSDLAEMASALEADGWVTGLDGLLVEAASLGDYQDAEVGESTAQSPLHYKLVNTFNGFVQRGRLSSQGVLPPTLTAPDSLYQIAYLDPTTLYVADTMFRSAANGQAYQIPRSVLLPSEAPDSDGDGLPDDAEDVVGTNPADMDTDDDGLRDGDEILGGTDALGDSPARTGIVATASFPELAAAQDLCGGDGMIAVAAGAEGVALFNVFAGMNPARTAQVDTPGTAQRVACAGSVGRFGEEGRTLLAVADGASGLAIIDATETPGAFVTMQVPLGSPALAVTAGGGVAYVGLASGEVVSVDLEDGAILQRLPLGESVQDLVLASSGTSDWLYVLGTERLHAVGLVGGAMDLSSSVGSPRAGPQHWRLFVGDATAWVVHGRGMNTFDLTEPGMPALITAGVTGQFGWKQIALNGTGLGIAAVSPNQAFDGPHEINVYDVGDPELINQFITTFETPAVARAVIVDRGKAYVADSAYGAAPGALHVLNYLASEFAAECPPAGGGGAACPSITLRTNFTSGSAESGQLVRLSAAVQDDVQARQVDFYASTEPIDLDATPIATDGSYPFEHRFRGPLLAPGVTTLHVRARVVDTGGNATWTPDLALALVPDATPPRLRLRSPHPGALTAGTRVVSARYSEALDPAGIGPSSLRVSAAGPDGLFDTPDDVAAVGVVGLTSDQSAVSITFENALAGGGYRALASGAIRDVAGNAAGADVSWFFRVVGGADRDGDGLSDDYETAYGLNVASPDQNGNGVADGLEDFDGDGLRNDGEAALLHHVFDGDSDSAATPANENDNGTSDANEDADADALRNAAEIAAGTDPLSADTDRDGVSDGDEVSGWGSDPLDPTSVSEPFRHHAAQVVREVVGGGSPFARSAPVRATPTVHLLAEGTQQPGGFASREIVLSTPDIRVLSIEYQKDGSRSPDAVVATPQVEFTLTP